MVSICNEKVYRELQRRHAALADATDKEIARLRAELEKSMLIKNRAEMSYFGAKRAGSNLAELERKNWELFSLPEPENAPAIFPPGNTGAR